jgi:group I intron endonuclease
MIIYQTTNLINGKKYIGKDIKNNPYYIGSGTLLKKAIKKYGKKNFKKEILEYCNNKEHLVEREKYWLEYFDVENNNNFYNKTNKPFGNSGLSEETKKKISKARIGKKLSEETKEKISKARTGIKSKEYKKGKNHGNYKKSKTKEHKTNMSLSRIGKKHSEEWKQAIKNNREKCILVKSKPILQLDKDYNIVKQERDELLEKYKGWKIIAGAQYANCE